MSANGEPQTFRLGRRVAVLAVVALLVGLAAMVLTLRTSPVRPQDAVAHIPVSTATPYPFATTSAPWRTTTANSTMSGTNP